MDMARFSITGEDAEGKRAVLSWHERYGFDSSSSTLAQAARDVVSQGTQLIAHHGLRRTKTLTADGRTRDGAFWTAWAVLEGAGFEPRRWEGSTPAAEIRPS